MARYVADVVQRLIAAIEPDDVVLGGGNVHKLQELLPKCRAGDNANAFRGGFRLWENAHTHTVRPIPQSIRLESAGKRKRQRHDQAPSNNADCPR